MALGCGHLADDPQHPKMGRVIPGARSEFQACWWPGFWLWGAPRNQQRGWSLFWGTARGNKVIPWVLAKVSVYQGGIEEPVELTASLQSLGANTCWVVLMMGGGHFAGAVFRG